MTITETYALPVDLAPALLGRLQRLLAEVSLTSAPALVIDLTYTGPRCVVCHEGGKLGGHHSQDGQVEWIHRACHRRLHRRGRLSRAERSRVHGLERRTSRPANGYRTTTR